ncbi:MAG: PhoH family protein, partial [Gammaproteobacteria bacterium]|nr:PhoH family protein [Gammaproteobacteria bacterium]
MNKRLFVIDSNVLMHDPTALFRFQEHDLYLPMMVLEELDHNKKGHSEVARNARQTSRFIDELMGNASKEEIEKGINLDVYKLNEDENAESGRLFFQTRAYPNSLPEYLPGSLPDNNILGTALSLQGKFNNHSITLVTKDINMRIKASILGLHSEDYHNDKVLEDVELLYKGNSELESNFWDNHGKELDSWVEEGHTYYRLHGPEVENWIPSQFIYTPEGDLEAIVREIKDDTAIIETTRDYTSNDHTVWGIRARNREQNFALNLLMDPEIDFVSLLGMAGTGKTLLTLAAGLEQTLEQKRYNEIIMTRVTVPVGEDIGYLPGTEEEKMAPWMGALMDNLEFLTDSDLGGDWGKAATQDLLSKRIKIRSVNFMRGRTFLNRFIIID